MMRIPYQPPARTPWRSRILWFLGIVILVLGLTTAGFALWALNIPAPMPEALAALESSSAVTVSQDQWITFSPTFIEPQSGLIFYPGGRVDARAYAPAAHAIAEAGHLVVIVPMPLNLAVFAPGSARAVMDAFPDVADWYVAGHSLGGAMAANFVYANPSCCAGLILWAAFPAENNSLANLDSLHVASIYGTLDGLATPDEILASRTLLPPSARLLPIAGGNHAQFGWYGAQNGDNPAAIDRATQQRLTVEATLAVMQSQ